MLLLKDSDVERLVSMGDAIEVVEEAFAQLARGRAEMPERLTMILREGSILLMPCHLEGFEIATTKIVSVYPDNPRRGLPTTTAWLIVNDPQTGVVEALMEATYLTALRTGAVTAVAARYLAPPGSRVAAVIGCGVQGRFQAWALSEAFKLESIWAYDISKGRRKGFVEEMGERLDVEVLEAESAGEAVRDADIVATATTSKEPVIHREQLRDEVHISAIGSFIPDHRELDTETVREAKLVVDSREAALKEAGDIILPLREGAITEEHIYAELGELVIGLKPGRVEGDGITVFKSVGLAIQDSAVAHLVLRRWREGLD
jgi:ornithine cyclodeaminase/alanine dehydrogenase